MTHSVTVYLQAGITYKFPARCVNHAREMANRIITDGVWVVEPDGEEKGTELFFPINLVSKVKIVAEK